MRKTALACVFAFLVTAPALAQDWTEYKSVRDGFQVNFLGQPHRLKEAPLPPRN